MSSSEKTEYLGLNKWLPDDRPKREDFNYDNEKIDNILQWANFPINTGEEGEEIKKLATLSTSDSINWDSGNLIIEEGGFAPRFESSDGKARLEYNKQLGQYIRIGKLIYLFISIEVSRVLNMGSGALLIKGFPYINASHAATTPTYVEGGKKGVLNQTKTMYFMASNGNMWLKRDTILNGIINPQTIINFEQVFDLGSDNVSITGSIICSIKE